MGIGILRYKFSHLLIFIFALMGALIIFFVTFMMLILSVTKQGEVITLNSLEATAQGVEVSRASDYLTTQARLYASTGKKIYLDNYLAEVNTTKRRDKAVDILTKLGISKDILSLVEQAKKDSDNLIKLEEASFKAVEKGDLQTAVNIMSGDEYNLGKEKIERSLNNFELEVNKFAKKQAADASSHSLSIIVSTIVIILVAVTIFMIVLFVFISSLRKALTILDKLFVSIADGNLDIKAPVLQGNSEICETFKYINVSLDNINDVLRNVTDATQEVASSNNELASTMEELSATFAEQAHQVNDTAVSLDSINNTVKATVDSLASNQTIVDSTVKFANDGKEQLFDLKSSMEKIHEDADSLSNTISNLANSSSQIGNIVTVINDIADQTNLLALNAAIEAARAGEAGRGFAVVADEVRKLAERTQHATSEVTTIVTTLQQEAVTASKVMGMEAAKVKEGVTNIEATEEVFHKIFSGIDSIQGVMNNIRSDMDNEYETVQNVHDTSKSIAVGIEESSNAVNEVTSTIEHLQERVENLKMMLSQFKISR